MARPGIRSRIPYCIALIATLSTGACGDRPAPAQSADPGNVARRVVAEYLSLEPAEVHVVSLEEREFEDSSLGCPEPGFAYQQVLTSGHRAGVEADGRRFDVRISGQHGRICHNPKRGGLSGVPDRGVEIASLVESARVDLAGRLGAATAEIQRLDVRPGDGTDPPRGCIPECPDDAAACGYFIGLAHDGRRYDYHAAGGQARPCPDISRR